MTDYETDLVREATSAREHLIEVVKAAMKLEGEGMKAHRGRMAILEMDALIQEVAFPDEADSLSLVH